MKARVSISPNQKGCSCRNSAVAVGGGSGRRMRGKSGDSQRPGEGGGGGAGGRTRGGGAGWVGPSHTQTHVYNLTSLWREKTGQPTSASPSFESIDTRPAGAESSFTPLIKPLVLWGLVLFLVYMASEVKNLSVILSEWLVKAGNFTTWTPVKVSAALRYTMYLVKDEGIQTFTCYDVAYHRLYSGSLLQKCNAEAFIF